MSTVEIFNSNSTTEAHLIKGLLAQHGIESEITGHYLQGAFGELPVTNMIQVVVDIQDERRAREVIERFENGEFELDNDED